MDDGFFLKLATGFFAAALLGLLGWGVAMLLLHAFAPLLLTLCMSSASMRRKMIYSREQEEKQERQMADYVRKICAELAKKNGIDEELKSHDPMKWVQKMNNAKVRAEKMVLCEVVYN